MFKRPALISLNMAPDLDSEQYGRSSTQEQLKHSTWNQPSPAAWDFRSDITTTATPALVNAVANPPIDDGWTGSGAKEFELHIARLTSRPAALFTVSSTMGNQLALRTYLNSPPNGVLCDSRSHLLHMEVGAVASISGGLLQTIIPSNGLYLTLEDIRKKVVLADGSDACVCPTRVIHLENPLGGIVMPLAELQRIKRFAEEHGLKVHMDGARLWEAVAAGAGSLDEFCAAVDSMNLCLTKGLGASVGAVLVGDAAFIHHCRWVRKIFGGAMRQPGWAAAAAWAAVDSVFGRDPSGRESALLRKSHGHAQMLAEHWLHLGGSLLVPQQTNMVWLDLNAAGIDEEDWELRGEEMGLKLHCGRLVTHHQITDEAVERLKELMSQMLKGQVQSLNGSPNVIRNEAVSRLTESMREAVVFSSSQQHSLSNGANGANEAKEA